MYLIQKMSAQHTPGPWKYYLTISDQGTVPQVQTEPVGPVGGQYATMICTLSRTGEKSAIREANARLIAAAPDMLAALYASEIALHSCLHQNVQIDAAFEQVRAAISKAEGVK